MIDSDIAMYFNRKPTVNLTFRQINNEIMQNVEMLKGWKDKMAKIYQNIKKY